MKWNVSGRSLEGLYSCQSTKWRDKNWHILSRRSSLCWCIDLNLTLIQDTAENALSHTCCGNQVGNDKDFWTLACHRRLPLKDVTEVRYASYGCNRSEMDKSGYGLPVTRSKVEKSYSHECRCLYEIGHLDFVIYSWIPEWKVQEQHTRDSRITSSSFGRRHAYQDCCSGSIMLLAQILVEVCGGQTIQMPYRTHSTWLCNQQAKLLTHKIIREAGWPILASKYLPYGQLRSIQQFLCWPAIKPLVIHF